MGERRDALVAAARFVLAADSAARAEEGAVATVGTLAVEPGGSNVVPARVTGTLDVRAPDPARRDAVVDAVRAACPRRRRWRSSPPMTASSSTSGSGALCTMRPAPS